MKMKWNVLAVAIVFSLACPIRANWTLVKSDFTERKGVTVNTWEGGGAAGLSITENGKLDKVETRDVLALISESPLPVDGLSVGGSVAAGWKLMLRNGDCLYGQPSRFSGQSMEFDVADGMGKILVPLKAAAGMSDVRATAAASHAEKDRVRLKNNDVLEGFIVSIDAKKLQIATGADDETVADIDLARVERLSFGGMTPARGVPALGARIRFVGGSVLTVPLDAKTHKNTFAWTIGDILFKDPAGKDRKISVNAVAAIDIVGGRVVYVSELDPVKDEQSTLMGTRWETQVDRNVMGEPLMVGRKVYQRGIGVHTSSSLVYELDGSFDVLKCQVGLDDSAVPHGAANVAVVVDGKVLWEAGGLKAGEAAVEVAVAIKGGRRLELRAVPALGDGKLDVLGRVNWLNVALLR
ncbi:MAG: NPCBM/NEW2 domain-containing protein [Phycisphaerales bacterium]|nr:NPCBM/NEW2 domain-containing protein [Phycisphaerales bacterium]